MFKRVGVMQQCLRVALRPGVLRKLASASGVATQRSFLLRSASTAAAGAADRTHGGHPTSKALRKARTPEAESGLSHLKYYHHSGKALAVLAPVALVLSPSVINLPVDLALNVVVPYHSYISTINVIEDYVPKAAQPSWKTVALIGAGIMAAGFLKLNVGGAGITETVKSLWREPKEEEEEEEVAAE